MEKKRQYFLIKEFQFIHVEGKREIEKSPLNYNNCLRKEPLLNAKISGRNFNKKAGIWIASEYLPQNIY